MGIIRALVESSERFEDERIFRELAVGFDFRPINWVVEFDPSSGKPTLRGRYKEEMIRAVPLRADRSGSVSADNIKPNLFVDNARYALGLEDGATTEFDSFKELHEIALKALLERGGGSGKDATESAEARRELDVILAYLRLSQTERKRCLGVAGELGEESGRGNEGKRKKKEDLPGPKDVVAFATIKRYPFDGEFARTFWMQHLQDNCSNEKGICAICGGGVAKPLLRILPFKVYLFGERCPILSVNTDEQQSFGSLGKGQLCNSPICVECAGKADRLLKFLIQMDTDDRGKETSAGRHAFVLARDQRQALGNQVAVFWTKQVEAFSAKDGEKIRFEDIARIPIDDLGDIPADVIPVKAGQLRALLEAPTAGGKNAAVLPANRFYLAVLSPNKSRLVVREWLEENVDKTLDNINRYLSALQIVHPDGRGTWWPALPALLDALRSFTSTRQKVKDRPRIPGLGPDVMRKFVRCVYTGTPPPDALLVRALRCFRVADPHTEDREQRERQMLRRMAMAAAMKLVLTYQKDKKEMRAMEELKTEHDDASEYKRQAPYNCGRLLAILEAAQRGPHGKGVNTTLVDRFYGAASTAPATVFANLINMATKAHLPKLRRECRELFRVRSREDSVNINDLMTEACDAINAAGGFPPPMKSEEQAQFALGFYHQRAEFSPSQKQPKSVLADGAVKTGGQ